MDLSIPQASGFNITDLPEITPLSHYLCGEAAFSALKDSVQSLVTSVPEDHDVVIQAFGIIVTQVRYREPHTLQFNGFDIEGHQTSVVAHFSQLVAHVVYVPKRGPERVVTGFARTSDP